MKVYLASSWRNREYPRVLESLRAAGHAVYDFRDPKTHFAWRQLGLNFDRPTTPAVQVEALRTPLARAGFQADMDALESCDACVLLMPCGRSAHLEAGYAAGRGKRTVVCVFGEGEPELMWNMATRLVTNLAQLLEALR